MRNRAFYIQRLQNRNSTKIPFFVLIELTKLNTLYQDKPLYKGAELYLLGQFCDEDLKSLRKRIKSAGITVVTSPTKGTTHLFLSEKLIGKYQSSFDELPFVTMQDLTAYLDKNVPQYIVEDATKYIPKLKQLLKNEESENHLLALQMMKKGGMPKDLLPLVYLRYFLSATDGVQSLAKRLILRYANIQLGAYLKPELLTHVTKKNIKERYKIAFIDTKMDTYEVLKMIYTDFKMRFMDMMRLLDNHLLNHSDADALEVLNLIGYNDKIKLEGLKKEVLDKYLPYLPQVKYDDLAIIDCGLTEVPSIIGTLSYLSDLDLSQNPIKVLPAFLNKFYISTLIFTDCALEDVSALKLKRSSVELDISYNNYHLIPKGLENLDCITKLNISNLKLDELPNLSKMSTLENLDMSSLKQYNNQSNFDFSTFIKNLKDLPALDELSLDSNDWITALPAEISLLQNLTFLDLDDCENLTKLPPEMVEMQELDTLYLKNTKCGFPDFIFEMPCLTEVSIGYELFREGNWRLLPNKNNCSVLC